MVAVEDVRNHGGSRWLSLRRDGVMVVLDVGGPYLPRVVHWGHDLGELSDDEICALPLAREQIRGHRPADKGIPITLLPTRAHGWPGWPGLTGHRHGLASQPLFSLEGVSADEHDGADVVQYRGVDAAAELEVDGALELTPEGVLKHRQTLTSTAPATEAEYEVEDFLTLLPVREDTVDLLDYAGRWANEAQLQRHQLSQGTWLREQRRGRTGPDTPLLLCAGSEGFGFRHGDVWGVHLGWSGDQRYLAQRLNTGITLVGAGEILAAGEVVLGAGESVTTPWVYAVFSRQGLDGASARLHSMLRRREQHPSKSRPVLLNTWEAVTFDQSYEKLAQLADIAAEVGVERFVIDDGWFGGRRDDSAGLGDWYVARDVWPDGLGPIVDHVRSLGMEFGLWFEPEMVNLDSDVARAHPDWVMGTSGRMPHSWRNQQVLDISNPGAFAYLLERLGSLVSEYRIDFIKWDHNRDLADPVHRAGPKRGARLCGTRHWPPTSSWTSCAGVTPLWKSSHVHRAVPAWTSAYWRGLTGCGPATTSTRWTARGSSWACQLCCRSSSSAPTSPRSALRPPGVATTWPSASPLPSSATRASNGTSPLPRLRSAAGWPNGWRWPSPCGRCSSVARSYVSSDRATPVRPSSAWWRRTSRKHCSPW